MDTENRTVHGCERQSGEVGDGGLGHRIIPIKNVKNVQKAKLQIYNPCA